MRKHRKGHMIFPPQGTRITAQGFGVFAEENQCCTGNVYDGPATYLRVFMRYVDSGLVRVYVYKTAILFLSV